jgi:hypothetical protein
LIQFVKGITQAKPDRPSKKAGKVPPKMEGITEKADIHAV